MSEQPTSADNTQGIPAGVPMTPVREQSEFLRQILDINPNLIFAKDRQGRFTLVNKTVADIYGTTVESLIGKTDADFNSNPEEVEFFRRMDLQVMDTLEEVVIPEEVITDAKGGTHWLQTVKRPIIGPDGKSNQILGVASDITHHKLLEEQLRHAQKMEALGELAGGIAHDFNNMLAVILTNAERLLDHANRKVVDSASMKSGLELILSSCDRAATLVRRLLTFSRKQPARPVVLDLNQSLKELTTVLQRLIGDGIELTFDSNGHNPHVRIDPVELEQVIVNLAVNARDAMPRGGRLTLSTTQQTIRANSATGYGLPAGEYAKLIISDTGSGMTPEVAQRIFEPFFTTKPTGKGTGLGLAIVYGIVKQAGGRITVDSTPGKGTRFEILVPVVSAS